MGRCFFLMLMIGQSLAKVNASSENVQNRGEKTEVSQRESKKRWKVVGYRWVMKEISNQKKGKTDVRCRETRKLSGAPC